MYSLSELFVDIAMMQEKYITVTENGKVTKGDICNICYPFKDKYHFSDVQTLMMARSKLSIAEILRLVKEGKYNVRYNGD